MDDLDTVTMWKTPTAARPLAGLTVLVVEDSRFACEALRLLCLRSGARIRRADCLASARRHLRVYRPSVLIVDLGLPDGSGADLIAEVAGEEPRIPAVLAMSGDPDGAPAALAAGACAFLPKPLTDLAAFQQAVLARLPAERHPEGPRAVVHERVRPDRLALRDDLAHAARVLETGGEGRLVYLAQFLRGVAGSAGDAPLYAAAEALGAACRSGDLPGAAVARLSGLVTERLERDAVM